MGAAAAVPNPGGARAGPGTSPDAASGSPAGPARPRRSKNAFILARKHAFPSNSRGAPPRIRPVRAPVGYRGDAAGEPGPKWPKTPFAAAPFVSSFRLARFG